MNLSQSRDAYNDLFVVRTHNVIQLAFMLAALDPFGRVEATPVWEEAMCFCGATTKGSMCADPDCVLFPRAWVPWQLAPDSDPAERWILVNEMDDGEEHPSGNLFDSREAASMFANDPDNYRCER